MTQPSALSQQEMWPKTRPVKVRRLNVVVAVAVVAVVLAKTLRVMRLPIRFLGSLGSAK